MTTDRVTETIVVSAELADVYATLSDYERYPEWLEQFDDVTVLTRRDDGLADSVSYRLSAMGISLGMTLAYTYTDTRIDWRLVAGDMITHNDGSYDLADNGDGTTTLTYALAVDTSIPVPGPMRRRFATRTVADSLRAIRRRVEHG